MMARMVRITFSYLVIVSLEFLINANTNHRIVDPLSIIENEINLINDIVIDHEDGLVDISSSCVKSLKSVSKGSRGGEELSIKVASSFKHVPPLLKSGHLADFGDYDTCLAIDSSGSNNNGNCDKSASCDVPQFVGKYCLYQQYFDTIPPKNPVLTAKNGSHRDYYKFLKFESLTGSICLPSTCSDEEITVILNNYFAPEGTHIKLRFNCDTKEKLSNDLKLENGLIDDGHYSKKESIESKLISTNYTGQAIALYALISWLLIIILINAYLSFSTSSSSNSSLESYSVKSKSLESMLECFSIRSNVTRLTDDDLNDDFKFIYGFRMVFLIGSTIFHVFFLPIFWSPLAVINILNFSREGHTWLNQEFGSNMSAGMPLAFVMAAFLSFKSRLKEFQVIKGWKETTRYLIRSLLNRSLRSLPAVGGCYLCILSFPKSWGSGPLFNSSYDLVIANCLKNWPFELLFAQNTLHPTDMCIMPSWILGPDIQLYFVSFAVIYCYQKDRIKTRWLIGFLVLISVVIEAIYILAWNLPPFMDLSTYDYRDLYDNQTGLHLNTINYIPAYLIGLQCAMLVHEKKTLENRKLFPLLVFVCWTAYLSNYFIPLSWRSRGESVTRFEKVLFGSTCRVVFAIAVSGAFLDQSNISPNGLTNKILSCKPLVVLGRFSFSSYLGHFMVMYYDVFTTKRPLEYDNYSIFTRTSTVLFYGIALGLLIHILFEAPFIRLSKIIIPRKIKQPRPSDQANNNVFIGSTSSTPSPDKKTK